jgi:glycosyltransferase involved in cell wall biosynthesis
LVLISIVTPSLNQGRFIERTLLSVLDQGIPDLELLVFDGASHDETLDVLRAYSSRCTWVSEPDAGQASAINKGLAVARGDIIGWLNSDDVYRPGALKRVIDFFETNPQVDLVYGNADFIAEDDSLIEPYYTEPWDPSRLRDVCFVCQPAAFFRRTVVERFGLLNEQLHYCMDYEYWLRMSVAGVNVGYIQECLAGSRLYATNKTLGSRLKFHAEINRMLRVRVGYVPDRWLTNEAHTRLDLLGMTYTKEPLRFALQVSALSWWLALRWNHRLSRSLLRTTGGWIAGACRLRATQCRLGVSEKLRLLRQRAPRM